MSISGFLLVVSLFLGTLVGICWGADTIDRPKLVVHIGPPKTGTTAIQDSMLKNLKKINTAGWYPMMARPGELAHRHGAVDDAFGAYFHKTPNNFFQQAIDNRQNVVISCEYLGSKLSSHMKLYGGVLKSFNTTVVMFLRDFLSLQISLHRQRQRKDSLVEYLVNENNLRHNPGTIGPMGDFERMLAWGNFDQMVILDYNGLVKKGVSFPYVFLCEVLGILCDDNSIKQNLVSNPTTHLRVEKLHAVQLANLFFTYAKEEGCKCDTAAFELAQNASSIPLVSADLGHLVAYSKMLDVEFRRQYGHLIRYSDQDATVAAINSHRYHKELDVRRILLSREWRQKFQDALNQQVESGQAKCVKTIKG